MRSIRLDRPFAWIALLGFTAGSAFGAASERFIVSDVDDTVKVTHVASTVDAIRRGLFSRKAFAGMSTLYRELNQSGGKLPIRFVSGSPKEIKGLVADFLEDNHFPSPWTLTLKKISEDTPDFKVRRIDSILQSSPDGTRAILIGDDGEKDPEVYATLQGMHPEMIDKIYIHRVRGRSLPQGQIGFDTASDIALRELAELNLSPYQSSVVAQAVIDEGTQDDEALFLPEYCPRAASLRLSDELAPRLGAEAATALRLARSAEDLIRQACEKQISD